MDRIPGQEEPQRLEEAPRQELARPGSVAQQPAATRAALATQPKAAVALRVAAPVELRPELRAAATLEPPEAPLAEPPEVVTVESREATVAELGPPRVQAVQWAVREWRAVQAVVRAARPGRVDPSLAWAVRHK